MDLLFLCTITGLVALAVIVAVFQMRQRRSKRTEQVQQKIDLFHNDEPGSSG